jgi:hypothetical protein
MSFGMLVNPGRLMNPRKRSASGFSPPASSNLKGWYKAGELMYSDAGTTLCVNNDPIRQWNDQSGNNNHMVQATLANRPTYKTNVKNGYPSSRGDGIDDFLNCGATANPCTIIAVTKDFNDAFPPRLYGQGQQYSIFADGATQNAWGIYNVVAGLSYLTGVDPTVVWAILGVPMDTGSLQQGRANGADRGGTYKMLVTPTSTVGIHNNGNTSAPLECGWNDIVEFAWYNTCLSTAQIQEWETYLNAKFAVY